MMRAITLPACCLGDLRWPRIGADLVPVGRIARAGQLDVLRYACGADELAAWPDRLRAGRTRAALNWTAATWAVKEAVVKAAGGRPPGFRWNHISVSHGIERPGAAGRLLGTALADLLAPGAVTRSLSPAWCEYEWLRPRGPARGIAAWCAVAEVVWALAMDSDPEPYQHAEAGDC